MTAAGGRSACSSIRTGCRRFYAGGGEGKAGDGGTDDGVAGGAVMRLGRSQAFRGGFVRHPRRVCEGLRFLKFSGFGGFAPLNDEVDLFWIHFRCIFPPAFRSGALLLRGGEGGEMVWVP